MSVGSISVLSMKYIHLSTVWPGCYNDLDHNNMIAIWASTDQVQTTVYIFVHPKHLQKSHCIASFSESSLLTLCTSITREILQLLKLLALGNTRKPQTFDPPRPATQSNVEQSPLEQNRHQTKQEHTRSLDYIKTYVVTTFHLKDFNLPKTCFN